jgi:hypothetical protein
MKRDDVPVARRPEIDSNVSGLANIGPDPKRVVPQVIAWRSEGFGGSGAGRVCERCGAGGRKVVDVDDGTDEDEEHEGEGEWEGVVPWV